jgi:hypothetical protein
MLLRIRRQMRHPQFDFAGPEIGYLNAERAHGLLPAEEAYRWCSTGLEKLRHLILRLESNPANENVKAGVLQTARGCSELR